MVDPLDIVKFGKKVSYDTKLNHNEVMEEHLKQMRLNVLSNKNTQSVRLQQEKDFLGQIKQLEGLERERKKHFDEAKQMDFRKSNNTLNEEVMAKRAVRRDEETGSRYSHFPFTSGDLIE
jgi:aspartate oxidase